MAKRKADGRKTLTGVKVVDETQSQLKIIEGQSMASSQNEVIEKAIDLLYSIMPEGKDGRKPLDLVVKEAIETIMSARAVEEKGVANE